VDKGVLRTDDLKLTAEAGMATAAGAADLPRWTMDFKSEFRLTEHPKAPPFRMEVRGPIDNPRRVFRFEQLQTFLLQRGIGTLLRKALPEPRTQGGGGAQTQPSEPSQPSQPSQPQEEQKPLSPGDELLRGIFETLRKR
jgi:hypothetical protein